MKERSGMPYDVVAYEADEAAMLLTPEQEGFFHRLLRRAWMNGSIPDDVEKLTLICRAVTRNQMRRAWEAIRPLWIAHPTEPGRLVNAKQEEERKFLDAKRKKAEDSARLRWSNPKRNNKRKNANALPTYTEGNASQPNPPQPVTTESPQEPPKGPVSLPRPTAELLVEIYNAHRGGKMPECRDLTPERRRKANQRIESHSRDPAKFIGDLREAVARCAQNAFLRGDVKAWRSSFDWLMKNDTNYQRVLEGVYDGRNKSKAEQRAERQNEAAKSALSHYMAPDLCGDDEDARGRGINEFENQELHRVAVGSKPG